MPWESKGTRASNGRKQSKTINHTHNLHVPSFVVVVVLNVHQCRPAANGPA